MTPIAPRIEIPAPSPPEPPVSVEPTVSLAGGACELGEAREVFRAERNEVRGVRLALDDDGGMLGVVHGRTLSLVPLDAAGAPGERVDRAAPASLERVVALTSPRAFGVLGVTTPYERVSLAVVGPTGATLDERTVELTHRDVDLYAVDGDLLFGAVAEYGLELYRYGVEATGLSEKEHRYATVRAWETVIGQRIVHRGDQVALIGAGRVADGYVGASPYVLLSGDRRRGYLWSFEGEDTPWILRSEAFDEGGRLILLEQLRARWRWRRWDSAEEGPIDPAALPPTFDAQLRARLDARDGRYRLVRRRATAEEVAPAIDLGPAGRRRAAMQRADLAWTGRRFAFARAEGEAVFLTSITCARGPAVGSTPNAAPPESVVEQRFAGASGRP